MAGVAILLLKPWIILFVVLACVWVAMTGVVVPLSVVYALWVVARSPERSSSSPHWTATRPGFWVYLNKLWIFRARHCESCGGGGVCACAQRRLPAHSSMM
jgi:hypothetical protein